ncbi:hypothetical protein Ppro_1898 [Pelobacter propionicus DSM 2379]|uniref:Uncharacterized protein n=1 Tax=Pelobacter propionicus (strain DSM 2379 / NBRC 103807 / OttBd1) TaxID=338966 RepID=A1AQ88_PELPD|nr:hypothetical protein Ppro_1898 [Pelobacter propionicus DSM 2379]
MVYPHCSLTALNTSDLSVLLPTQDLLITVSIGHKVPLVTQYLKDCAVSNESVSVFTDVAGIRGTCQFLTDITSRSHQHGPIRL